MTTALRPLTDFPDRLSPMVVKELRQGLRTRAFSSTLLLLHVLLILVTLMTAVADGSADDTRWLYDGIATLVLCLVLPFRVSNALAEEIKHGTLDMLMLTRISPGRIVLGKWASVVLQSLLITLSLAPYIVARYVFGGLELAPELLMLAAKWLAGSVITAAILSLSTLRQAWLRMVILFVPLFFGSFGLLSYFVMTATGRSGTMFSASGTPLIQVLIILGVVCLAAWAVFAFLSLAASRISPPGQPLAWLKRSVHALTLLILGLLYLTTSNPLFFTAASPVLAFMTLDALTESSNTVPSAYAAFYRRGATGRVLAWVLSPGWVSGFWLACLCSLFLGVILALDIGTDSLPYLFLGFSTVCMINFLIQVLPTRHSTDLLPVFLGALAVLYLFAGVFSGLGIMVAKASGGPAWYLAVFPPAATVIAPSLSAGDRPSFIIQAVSFATLWPVLHAFLSLRVWQKLRPVREKARQLARSAS